MLLISLPLNFISLNLESGTNLNKPSSVSTISLGQKGPSIIVLLFFWIKSS